MNEELTKILQSIELYGGRRYTEGYREALREVRNRVHAKKSGESSGEDRNNLELENSSRESSSP
jgi:hypothetical protein